MSYDIPPELHHKEKIIFGLTFSQLAWAFPAFLVILFLILKTKWPIKISGTISIVVLFAAFFFMFLDGKNKVNNWYHYLLNREVKVNSDKLKQIIDIKKVENNIIIRSKTKLSILEVIPMNFMLKTEEEQDSIMVGFKKFLNSLDFPIQIHITSSPIDLTNHYKHVKKQTDNNLTESYCSFINEKIKENNVQNRHFYIIIKERDNLEIQTSVCMEKLQSLGLKAKILEDESIINMFHKYIANNKQKESAEEEIKDLAHFMFSPEKVLFYSDSFQIDNTYCKVIAVTGYPNSVESGFLDKIISSGEKYDISIHIEPYPIETTMIQLNRELQKQQSDLYSESQKGILNPSLEIKFQSTRKVLEDLQRGKQKLFDVSLYIMCRGDTKEEAELLARKVKSNLDGLMIQNKVTKFQMIDAYSSMLPLNTNKLKINRNIHTEGLSAFFPFSSPFLDIEDEGILLGLNKNKIPYIKNIFGLANANGLVLATSGAGKSYAVKLLLSRQHLNGCDILIIDPQGEYLAITKHYKGETITISKSSEAIINPLDLMGHDYLEKRLSLMDLFKIMFEGDLNQLQKSILDKAIDLTYENCGITKDDYESHEPPIMSDLYKTIENLEKLSPRQEKVTYTAIKNRLYMFTQKGVFGFLDRQTKINFENNFVCFNIGSMPKQVKPAVMYLVLDHVYMKMKGSTKRKLLVIDEAWAMLQTAEESSYIFEIVKTCRKFNLGLLMITQDVADLVGSKAGNAVLANTSYTFLLRQRPAVISNVVKAFNLSKNERDYLVSAKLGTGILILENEHQELEVVASPEEHKLITTNPDELIKLSEKEKPKESLNKKEQEKGNLDLNKAVIPAKDITILQQNILNNHGYILRKCHNLESGPYPYYIKPRHPGSAEHTFLVEIIVEEIKKYTSKVWTYQTKKPDIIFINKVGQEIALEIETGIDFSKHKNRLIEKFNEVKKTMKNRCYIVLTNREQLNRYIRFGFPILSRNDISKFVKLQFSNKTNLNIGKELNLTNY